MKHCIKILIKYVVISMLILLALSFVPEQYTINPWFNLLALIAPIMIGLMLIELGKPIKDISLKRKYNTCIIVFVSQIVVFSLIGAILKLEENSIWGLLSSFVVFSTLIGFLLKIIKEHKAKLSVIKIPVFGGSVVGLLYFLIVMMVFLMVILTLLILFGNL